MSPASSSEAQPPASGGVHVGVTAGGLFAQGFANAGVLEVALVLPTPDWHVDARIGAVAYFVDTDATGAKGGMIVAKSNVWWGVYGLGVAAGLGYAGFNATKGGGWSDSSGTLAVWASPVQLAFGRSPRFEVGLHAGIIEIFAHDIRPWGYVSLGLVF